MELLSARSQMCTADAATPMPGLIVPFLAFTSLFILLGAVVILTLRAHVFHSLGDRPGSSGEAA